MSRALSWAARTWAWIRQASDDLDGNACRPCAQQDVDGPEVAGDRDRCLEEDLPGGADAGEEPGDVAGLGLVANAAADRPELD